MNMDDFEDAAQRHLVDAQVLFAQTPPRLAGASHLFGLSAECALKAIARKCNPNASFRGTKGHLPKLLDELLNVAPTLTRNPQLVQQINRLKPDWSAWEVSQRYHAQSTFVAATVAQQEQGAKQAHLLMNNYLSGL